ITLQDGVIYPRTKAISQGRRYKCLICHGYDLCASCYESDATIARHTTDHPMQRILTRVDVDLYYGGEASSVEQPQVSESCPICIKNNPKPGKRGLPEGTQRLGEHPVLQAA
uniref:RING-type E3 ubiquitin transferase n=1 Tax=Balaenoptera musculus TaxID=9771 RepID=A0A8C0DBM3_BALMU